MNTIRACALVALASAAAAPAVLADTIVGLTGSNALVRFDSQTMATVGGPVSISGLQANETILGIDFRPSNGMLYGVGSSNRLYIIDPSSGSASAVGGQFSTPLAGPAGGTLRVGIDFNPVADALRVVTNGRQNFSVNPNTGVATRQTDLSFAAGDPNAAAMPRIVGAAYTNSFPGATSTRLFTIDSELDILAVQNSAFAAGVQTSVGSLFIDTGELFGFDISPSGVAFASYNVDGFPNSSLYSIDLTSGAAAFLGGLEFEQRLTDIAVVPAPGALVLAGLGGLLASRRRR
jgi:hypothetical protein